MSHFSTIMYSQSFTPNELYKCTTQVERRNSKKKKEEIIQAIKSEIGDKISDGSYQFQIKYVQKLFLNAHQKKSDGYLFQNLVLRKLHKNIKHIYSVHQADRNNIVKQMKLLLSEDVDMWIVRLDIRHFYETIDRNKILTKLFDDARLSYESLLLLESLFSNPVISARSGLPRGLGISSVLSELYLKYFDLELKRVEGVYYYARFVDDIIVFCSSEESKDLVWFFAHEELKKIGLEINTDKSVRLKLSNGTVFTYLGYSFRKVNGKLCVSIDQKKLKVIKTRLTKSFVRFSKEHNFDLLKLRIKFLTGNYTLYNPSTLLPIKVGIYFNYKMATGDVIELKGLDAYYQRLLHCQKWRLVNEIGLSPQNIKDLEKYSFQFGYKNHVNHYFSDEKMSEVTSCWR